MEMAFEFNTLHRGRGGVGPAERVAHLQMDDSRKRHGGPDLRPWSPDGGGAPRGGHRAPIGEDHGGVGRGQQCGVHPALLDRTTQVDRIADEDPEVSLRAAGLVARPRARRHGACIPGRTIHAVNARPVSESLGATSSCIGVHGPLVGEATGGRAQSDAATATATAAVATIVHADPDAALSTVLSIATRASIGADDAIGSDLDRVRLQLDRSTGSTSCAGTSCTRATGGFGPESPSPPSLRIDPFTMIDPDSMRMLPPPSPPLALA